MIAIDSEVSNFLGRYATKACVLTCERSGYWKTWETTVVGTWKSIRTEKKLKKLSEVRIRVKR